jgi:hypothetical protein
MHELEVYSPTLGHTALMPSSEFFRHIQQHRRLLHAFVSGRSVELLTREFQAQLSNLIEQNLRALSSGESASLVPLSIVARFVANSFFLLVQWWLENDLRHSPEQMDEMFQKLVMPGVRAALGMDV